VSELYRPEDPPSERNLAAREASAFLTARGLCRCGAVRHPSKKFYWFWCDSGYGSADVRVYSVGYWWVSWTRYDTNGRQELVFGSAEEAMAFLTLALEDGDPAGALLVPRRPRLRENGRRNTGPGGGQPKGTDES
jgi:hypothetical protein